MMKKLLFLTLLASASLFASAKVGYLMTAASIAELPAENEGGVDQKPEQNAANWFLSAYGTNAQFVSLSELATLDPTTVKVLWINIDRTGLADLAAAGIDAAAVTAIGNYVKAGGNLLLTKQAARLVSATGRIGYDNNWSNVGYNDGGDTWYIKTKLGGGTANPTDRSNHAIYKNITKDENGQFPLVGPVKRSDRNNNWGDYMRKDGAGDAHYDNMNVQRLLDFEGDWNCEALATWPHINDYCLPMIINFKPGYETFTGGMLAICLAAYQWGTANNDPTNIGNVRRLTQNAIEYLYGSDPRPQVEASWNVTPADGTIGGAMTASVTTTGTISWSSSDNTVASVSSEGVIAYNGFGSCTITAVVSKDGFADKNLTQTITIIGGTAATYAYILPYSLYTMSHYDNEEGYYPDYQTAKWFYDAYVSQGTGFFLSPSDDIPTSVKVIWVHNDHVGLSSEQFYSDFGGNTFRDKLSNFVKAGGNVFLSKQATRLVHDIGRCAAQPVYRINGWLDYNTDQKYMTANFYALKDAEEQRVGYDKHTHEVYKYMPNDAWQTHDEGGSLVYCKWYIWDANEGSNRRTDNNFNWESWDGYADAVHLARATKFESDYSCSILGGYGHTTALDGAAFVEFLPQGDYDGTVIALGLLTYQWGTNNSQISNIQYLTKGVLEYLATDIAETYERDVRSGYFGTICLPKASTSFTGAEMFELDTKTADGNGIELTQVDALEAGKPYIFLANASKLVVTLTGAAVAEAIPNKGLIGNLDDSDISVPMDKLILKDNQLYIVDTDNVKVAKNRAYIDPTQVPAYPTTPKTSARRALRIHNTPTDVEALENTPAADRKIIRNGTLYIIHDGKTYNAQGQCVE